ncbi:Rof/RNase P-like protein [Gorgonomyces haynaldii]|nr:Rof/RNase P-like protein [Gorgonomyces haynaldii]
MKDSWHKPLPATIVPHTETPQYDRKLVQDILQDNPKSNRIFEEKVNTKTVQTDNPVTNPSIRLEKKQLKKQRRKKLWNRKERKQSGLYEIKETQYDFYLPLHEMWKQYIEKAVDLTNHEAMANQLLKADFHGCLMTIVQSKSPFYVGISGICVRDTENTFQLVTPTNELKIVPKQNNIFQFEIKNKIIKLFGSHLRTRPQDRANKKFKPKTTVEM